MTNLKGRIKAVFLTSFLSKIVNQYGNALGKLQFEDVQKYIEIEKELNVKVLRIKE